MITNVLILLALGFAVLGALRFAASPPRPRWLAPALVGVAVAAALWRLGVVGLLAGAAAAAVVWGLPRLRTRFAPDMTPTDAQALLGLGPTADEADIRAAHRRRIAAAHPDRGGDPQLAARLNAARDVLLKALRSKG